MGRSSHQARTTLGCQSKSFIPSSRKDIEALAGQNSVSKTPSKETWHGKGFCQGAGTKKLTTDHSGENLYEGSRHRIQWTAFSSIHVFHLRALMVVHLLRNKLILQQSYLKTGVMQT